MKKISTLLVVSTLLLMIVCAAGLAETVEAYPLCTVLNCNYSEDHAHHGIFYSGHFMEDGHDYHLLCNVQNCKEVGSHEHHGVTHMAHHADDGHSYHRNNTSHSSEHKNGGSSGHRGGGRPH